MPRSPCDASGEPDSSSPSGLRIDDPGLRGRPVRVTFEGTAIEAYEGESIAAALLAAGHRALRTTGVRGEPRGLFCNMGICFECLVQVDDRPNVRACQTPVVEGMLIKRQQDTGSWEPGS